MIVFRIVLAISVISLCVGAIAFLLDLFRKPNQHKPYGLYERFFKRFLDAFLATGALIVLFPVLLVIAVLVRVKLGAPILFAQIRPGKDEKVFKLIKFRSMTNQRDERGRLLPDDVRLTGFGRTLRSTSLDELPELLNIIKGDMSLVGPRPLLVEYLPYYTEREHHRHDVRPGLTGLAQVNGRNAISWDDKLAYDVQYVSEITFLSDVRIVKETLIKTVKRSDIQVGADFKMGKFINQRKERMEKTGEKGL